MSKGSSTDDFFYIADRSYDDLAEKALPHYHEAHRLLVASLTFPRNSELDIIDLGVGTGVTSAYLLRSFPYAHITGVDLFEEMIDVARMRLMQFSDRVSLVQSDNTIFLKSLERKVDAVVSAFCIHHQDRSGKQHLFSCIRSCLRPGGQFVMLDLTTFRNSHLRQISRDATIKYMTSRVASSGDQERWTRHWEEKNLLSPSDQMIVWLREAGLAAETVGRWLEVSLISAFAEGNVQ